MPIEFRCTQCNKLLRTPDETAGKQAKCPQCGAIVSVPAPEAPSQGPPPPADSQSPFGPSSAPAGQPAGPPDSENPYQSPPSYATAPSPFAAASQIQHTYAEFGDVFGRSWAIFKDQMGMCLGVVLLAWVINMGVGLAAGMIPFLGGLISAAFSLWINIGVTMALLRIARGQPTEIGEIFRGGPYFLSVLGASMLVGLILFGVLLLCAAPVIGVAIFVMQGAPPEAILFTCIFLGVLCYIPAMILWFMYSQFLYLIVDGRALAVESLGLSKQVMVGNKLTLFALGAVVGLIALGIALVTCGVGILLVMPFVQLLNVVFYLVVTGQPTADQVQPAYQPYQPPAGPTPTEGSAGPGNP